MKYTPKVVRSPFVYVGGKFGFRKTIIPLIEGGDSYCEPFAGGAAIFFAKKLAKYTFLSDIDGNLINTLKKIRDDLPEFLYILGKMKPSQEFYEQIRHEEVEDDVERAVRYFYLNHTSFSGIMHPKYRGYSYNTKHMQAKNWPKRLEAASEKLQNVTLLCRDFADMLDVVPNDTILFIDPPYYTRKQARIYTHAFTVDDHIRLWECLQIHSSRIKFILSYNDHPHIRDAYAWAKKIWPYTLQYSVSKQLKNKPSLLGQEILISNYDI